MDFVVVGLGVGALAVLLGLTIRELGSRWWSLAPGVPLSSPDQVRRLAIGRVSRAGGSVLSLAGVLILIATIVAIGLGLPDRTGAIVVMAVVTVAVLGTVAWGAIYAFRHHPPAARPARRPRPPAEAIPDQPPSLAGTIDATFANDDRLPAADHDPGDHVDDAAPGPEAPVAALAVANPPETIAAPTPASATATIGRETPTGAQDSATTRGAPDTPPSPAGPTGPDGPVDGRAPAAMANGQAEAAPKTPQAAPATNPAPEPRPAIHPGKATQAGTRLSGPPAGGLPASAARSASATGPNAHEPAERTPPAATPGDGAPPAAIPASAAAFARLDDAQDANGTASDTPAADLPNPALTDSSLPPSGQTRPDRNERPT